MARNNKSKPEDLDITSLLRNGADLDTIANTSAAGLPDILRILADALQAGKIQYTDRKFVPCKNAGGFADKSGDLTRVLAKYTLPDSFPKKALADASHIRALGAEALAKRPHIRERIITIDAEEAKDLDDAVSLKTTEHGWELGIHIADVSAYVLPGSLLDKEARKRGTSVYLNHAVIPMFPPLLSDDLCSLNTGAPKLAFTAHISLDHNAVLRRVHFERTVIHVARRFSYTEVNAILQGKKDPDAPLLREMRTLARLLRKERHIRGSLGIESPEIRILLDQNGQPIEVRAIKRGEAEMIIEDLMVYTNELVASFLKRNGLALYRVHPEPESERIREFVQYANALGASVSAPKDTRARSMQVLLNKIRGTQHESILYMLFLRTMQKAVYSTEDQGHYGLAASHYTHFTSPIRRYPDLVVHRLLAAAIAAKHRPESSVRRTDAAYTQKELHTIAEQASALEQRAVDAERDYARLKGARFLAGHVGEIFTGKIASLTAWGMFITLGSIGLEGLLHVSSLKDDYYRLDAQGFALTGQRNKKSFALGGTIQVRIKNVDCEKGFVDLEPAESGKTDSAVRRPRKSF
ncbi:MAG: VacB/RNase II family 3'-5' exoribonuclease [Spirochaetota bacterium]|nr:VacB/RNase II family 3'-5' exoribonuclease [Spirochaetota bacterium]